MEEHNKQETVNSSDIESYGLNKIEITLHNTEGVFFSGESVKGTLELDLKQPIEAFGIYVRCKGEARVHFTDRSVGIRRKYRDRESYVLEKLFILGNGEFSLEVNSGSYPFEIKIPKIAPCSFEGMYGRIRYSIKGTLLIKKNLSFSTNILPFTVSNPYNLNDDPMASVPIAEDHSKLFIGQKGPLQMSLSLPVRGFVPGQTVPMKITLNNSSNVRVAKIRIVLKKVVTYHAREKSRKHKEIIIEIELLIEKNNENIMEYFDIPSIPPSGLVHCNIIDITYSLKIEACVDLHEWYYRMLEKNLKIRTSIIIGTIPIKNYQDIIDLPIIQNNDKLFSLLDNGQDFQKSLTYKSSKPNKDDPNGDDGDSDGETINYSPLYRVYKFKKNS